MVLASFVFRSIAAAATSFGFKLLQAFNSFGLLRINKLAAAASPLFPPSRGKEREKGL